jgi:hypothetical protein
MDFLNPNLRPGLQRQESVECALLAYREPRVLGSEVFAISDFGLDLGISPRYHESSVEKLNYVP